MRLFSFLIVLFVGALLIPVVVSILEAFDNDYFTQIEGLSALERLFPDLLIITFLLVFALAVLYSMGVVLYSVKESLKKPTYRKRK